jgi:hypothetical protein
MSQRISVFTWRFLTLIMLLALVLPVQVNSPALAAPPNQAEDPQAPVDQIAEPQAPAAPGDHLVLNISLNPDSPNILRTNQDVNVNFTYITNEPSGVRIFVRPYTNGALTPNYAAHPSGLYPTGSGQGSGWFTITSGEVVVDQIRFTIWDAIQATLLFEAYLPVHYLFTPADDAVFSIAWGPDTPNVLPLNQDASQRFGYATREQGGVRIFVRPFTNGALTPSYAAHGSPLYPIGGGNGTGSFTITSGQPVVDQVRIQMLNADQSVLLFEAFLPVYYRFKTQTNSVTNISLSPDTPNIFRYQDNVNLNFTYNTNWPAGVRIWARPFSGASLSPNYAAHGSIVHSTGGGSATGSFRLTTGPMVVDKIRIQMWDPDQTVLLFEAFLPVHLLWAGAGPPPGPDMSLTALEVTQAIQDLNNSVELVAGKRTYVRVHATTPVNINDVFATLSGRRGFVTLTPTLNPGNPGADVNVRTNPDRSQINDSFWFELPSSWTTSGSLTLTARLDPNGAKFDPNTSNNVLSRTVNFQTTPPLRLRIVNVQYNSGGNTYLESNFHLNALESWLRRAYPINSLQVTRTTMAYPHNGLPNVDTLHVYLAIAKIFRILFSGEDVRVVYYGVVDDGGGFMRGKAAGIPGTIAAGPSGTDNWGWDFDGSYNDWYGGHEIGHTRGRSHANFCGAGGGGAYPYTSGRISPALTGNTAIYGFDITTRAIYGPDWKDVMTYCSNQWVSDFTYEGIRSYLVGSGLQLLSAESVTADEFLTVMGLADLEFNTATLESVYQVSQTATVPLPEPGDWTIALLDAGDNDLATYSFQPDELTDAEESPGTPAVIAEVVPWAPGAVKVEIRYGDEVVDSSSASANAPVVSLTSPTDGSVLPEGPFTVTWDGSDVDGDPLAYSLLYSNDGGTSWETLLTGLSAEEAELDTAQLPGGSGMLRVLATDGFLSAMDTSGAFTVPLHAPDASIILPNPDQVFFPTQQVTLQGTAYDLEDGSLEDPAFEWSSSLDGVLGTGATFNTTELTTGAHVITLTVTDSDGMSASVERSITIADEDYVEAVNLDTSPTNVYVTARFGDPAIDYLMTLRSSGETEFDWNASENIPWLVLGANSGSTPADLNLTLNPAGLPVGVYTDVITFTSADAANSPVEVVVTLEITGEALYLPSVSRESP